MNKEELIRALKNYLESKELMNQFNLKCVPLLEEEKGNLREEETNWESFVLSSLQHALVKSPTIGREVFLFYHWRVKGLPPVKEVYDYFCQNDKWVNTPGDKKWCRGKNGRCWEKDQGEFDAVLKDGNGNWLAIFEYEDNHNDCCQELCRMLKVIRWLKNQKNAHQEPVLCLFYWLPHEPLKEFKNSKENLEEYIGFIDNNFSGTKFVIVLQSGPDEQPYKITKTKVVLDEDFNDLENIIREQFEPSTY